MSVAASVSSTVAGYASSAPAAPATSTILGWLRNQFGLDPTWPPPGIRRTWEEIEMWAAFRESNEVYLRQFEGVSYYERYLISPVPRMISRASANLLFGAVPDVDPADPADEDRLAEIVEGNELPAELHRAAVIASSEGEVWGRIALRPDLVDVPIIEFVSRRNVIPHFAGRFCTGATFMSEWATSTVERYRLFETYGPGWIHSELYRGTTTNLGQSVPLTSFPATAGMVEAVFTGVDKPLVAFIPNSIDADPTRGYGDYCGLRDRFLSTNRATTIGDTNTELAGKKRAIVDATLTGRGGILTDDDVFVRHAEQGDIDDEPPFQILEYSYDAQQIVTWLDYLIDSTLQFGSISPALVGRQTEGAHQSGTALRFRMIHSLLEASGKGRFFDRGAKRLLRFAAMVDATGFGRPWTKPDEDPAVERKDALPVDDLEAAQELSLLVAAESISIEERVAFLHPDWDQKAIDEEVARLQKENAPAPVAPPPPVNPRVTDPLPGGGNQPPAPAPPPAPTR